MKKLINFETHSHAAPAQLVGSISFEMECEQFVKNGYRLASSNTVQCRDVSTGFSLVRQSLYGERNLPC